MPLTRKDLKERLNPTNNAVPTGKDYAAFVNSVLNLRDHQFYGVWLTNEPYYTGALVFHGKAFYVLECEPGKAYCTAMPPDSDSNWHKVQENITDDDWYFSEDLRSLHANPSVVSVGIGTPNPQATLDVFANTCGQIKLQPNLRDPQLSITNLDPACKENKLTLRVTTQQAELETDSPDGFRLIKNNKAASTKFVSILSANATEEAQPRIGIGTNEPVAHLDVTQENVGSILLDAGERDGSPAMILTNSGGNDAKKGNGKGSELKVSAKEAEIEVVVNSRRGLLFKNQTDKDDLKTQLYLAANGNVGIGTLKSPTASLQIENPADARDGVLKFGFCNTYPVVQLINNRVPDKNGAYHNSFVSGAATDEAVMKTDSKLGFVFKKPIKYPASDLDISDLNEGAALARIYPDGTMTVGDLSNGIFRFDVDGAIHAVSLYLEADRKDIDLSACEPLGEVMARICALKPLRYKWKTPPLEKDTDKWEIGFLADEMKPQFAEVVAKNAIAYQNLVPVLVKAIQEQQEMIEKLTNKYKKLKERVEALECR
ncbi:MAG: tail fiber domain-containing protein [Saprospiraceae bacterium]